MSHPDFFGIEADTSLFSLGRIPEHVGRGWTFFTGGEAWYGSAPIVFWLAVAGAVYGFYEGWTRRREISDALKAVLVLLAVTFAVQAVLILAFYWGDLTLPEASRYGIVFLPMLALAAVFLLARGTDRLRASRSYALSLAAGLILLYWPFGVESWAATYGPPYWEYHTNVDYLEEHFPEPDHLIVFDTPTWFLVNGWGAISGEYANENRDRLLAYLAERRFREILVLQVINYSDGQPSEDSVHLDPGFALEPLFEAQVSEEGFTRISRVRLSRPHIE